MKKRSDANSNPKQPDWIFFTDRSLGDKKVAQALRQAGAHVKIHDDHFPPDAQDKDWLREVGRRGWVVLSKDRKIRYRTLELATLKKARVRAFVLTSGNLTGEEMGQIFAKSLQRINRFAAKHSPPFIASLTRGGSISLLYPKTRK